MKELSKIARIYDELLKNKTSKFIRSSFNEKEEKLFSLLQTEVSDNTIAKNIYNVSPSHQSYQSLKRSLLEKLHAIIFTTNTGKGYSKQRLDVSREFLVIRILTILKLRDICIPMAQKTLKKCQRFQMFYEASEICRLLSEHNAVYAKNISEGEHYYKLSVDYIDIYREELRAAWQYQYFRSLYGTKAFEESADKIAIVTHELMGNVGLKSKRLAFFYYDLKFFEYYIRKDNDKMVDVCNEAIAYFDALPFSHDSLKNVFVFHLIELYLITNELEKAKELIISFLDKTDKKSPSYYRYKELLLRIYLFEGRYEKAEEIYQYLEKNIRKLANIYTKDRLILYELYLSILSNREVNFRKVNYNINKIKQDKKGLHVPYLIARAVYQYLNDPDILIDKLDALNQYSYKYLKEGQFNRTRQFIKILNEIMSGKGIDEVQLNEASEQISNYSLEMVSYDILLEKMKSRVELV